MSARVDIREVHARLTLAAIADRYRLAFAFEPGSGLRVCGWCPGCGNARTWRRSRQGIAVSATGRWLCRRCGLFGRNLLALVGELEQLRRGAADFRRALVIAADIAGVPTGRRAAGRAPPAYHREHRARTSRQPVTAARAA